LQKEKTARPVSCRDSRLSALRADRRLVNSVLNRFKHLRLMNLVVDCSNEIKFIASRFREIDISRLENFEQSIIERIMPSTKLVIKSDLWLSETIWRFIEKDRMNFIMIQFI
jgi:hypothetical protein